MKVKVTLIKSPIAALQKHKDTVKALGLRKIGHTVTHEDSESLRGQLFRVRHMVKVEEITQ